MDDDDATLKYVNSTFETCNPKEGAKVIIGPNLDFPDVVSFCTLKEVAIPEGLHFSNPINVKRPNVLR